MTAIHEETDVDWFAVLDFEHELTCETDRKECSNKAEWAARTRCCGKLYLVCDPCKILAIEVIARHKNDLLTCIACKTRDIRYIDFFGEFVRI